MPIRRTSLQAAADVFLVLGLEGFDFGFFLHVGANQACAGEILLRAGGDVGEHGLNALEALVNAAAEGLDDDADCGQRQEREQRQPGADGDHERQRAHRVDQRVGGIHDRWTEQHANGVQVVGRPRHNVAGAMALVVGVAQVFQAGEKIVAEIELDVARNANHHPAREELEDSFSDGDGEKHSRVDEQLVLGNAGVQIVGSFADHQREQDPDAIGEQDADAAENVCPAITFYVRKQRPQALGKHQKV